MVWIQQSANNTIVYCLCFITHYSQACFGRQTLQLPWHPLGASGPRIPNEVISTLSVVSGEIHEALKGALPAVLLLGNECSTDNPLPIHLGIVGRTYENLMSIFLMESNMTRVYTNACVQVHMRGRKLLRTTEVEHSKTYVTPVERGVAIKASW